MPQPMDKIALITGASRGIGAATARLLGSRSYAVAVNYTKGKDAAESVVADIVGRGGKAIAVKADVARPDEITAMFAMVDRELGPVTALVNNAAFNPSAAFEETSLEVLEQVYRTNVFGAYLCAQEAVKRMKQSGGAIVNVSSQAATFGGNQLTAYASSKAAVNCLVLGMARELAAYNIRVNNVSPGIIDTGVHPQAKAEQLKASIPLGRMGEPEEVAQAIAWLLSDEASYVSGIVLPVAGAR